jgi:hypothetical protein
MSPVSKGLALVLAAGVTVGTSALTRVPADFGRGDEGALRLSWRMDGVSSERCVTRSAEELARLPVHMRSPTECKGHVASYRLLVRIDGTTVLEDTVAPPGARGDRPVTVLREMPLPPGRYGVEVAFDALLPDDADVSEGIARLSWAGELRVEPRQVALVTSDADGRTLILRGN